MSYFHNQNQTEHSINRYNPLVLPSLYNLDVEKLESDFAKELQKNKSLANKEKVRDYK